jgi:L-alanine-DL-glutamate epimerase-like enolase superfamily enzyme
MRRFSAHREFWPLARPFRIANHEWRAIESLVVELEQDGQVGRGEAQGVFYPGEPA